MYFETVQDSGMVFKIANKKLYALYRMVISPMTLSDL